MSIHSTAIIHPTAKIAKNVNIDAYAVIGPDVVIADGCHIRAHTVLEYAELGENCVVYPFVSIGLEPQHLKYKGEKTKVVVGARCQFRESVTIHRGTALDKNVTIIGNDCYFMALSHVAHDCVIGDNVVMANGAQLAGHVQVGNNVFISTTVGIHQFTRIGAGALISGGAMVPLDVAPFCIAQGDRATLKGLNVIGMRRMGLKKENIKAVKEAYRAVFHSKLLLAEALKTAALQSEDPYVAMFRQFLSSPKRGYIRPEEIAV